MNNVRQFRDSAAAGADSQAYADAFNEVKNVGGDGVTTPTMRTAEQTEIGLFWAYDGTKGLGTPPRLYNQIARVIADQQGNSEYQNARMFALVNVAMADAGIACWNEKYVYDFWRPVIGIRNAKVDGNVQTMADATWTPLGARPAIKAARISRPRSRPTHRATRLLARRCLRLWHTSTAPTTSRSHLHRTS